MDLHHVLALSKLNLADIVNDVGNGLKNVLQPGIIQAAKFDVGLGQSESAQQNVIVILQDASIF